ncbi:MAG: hypothetical protein P8183_05870 [Anaerolineae bacterium]
MMQSKEKIVPLPGIWATIAAGFDVIAIHFWIIVIPVLLDSFLWLGPRLSIRPLLEQMVTFWQQGPTIPGVDFSLLLDLAPRTNLFTSLSVPILGVPVLMTGLTPEKTPLPTTLFELNNAVEMFLLFVLFSLLGLVLTAVYMTLTASVIQHQPIRQALSRMAINWLKLMGLVVTVFIFAVMVYIPLAIVGVLTALLSETLASLVLLMGPLLIAWVVIYLVFVPHGIFVNGRPLFRAMIESLQLMRHFLLPTITLLLTILIIRRGMDWLLLMADDGSWLTWVSIWGHAFVSTALLAASFIFYRDRYALLFQPVASSISDTGPAEQRPEQGTN